jgi:phosphoribosylanthranilate isomerase
VSRPEVKICGLTRRLDAEAAAAAGVAYLGAVFAPESPRCVTPREAARLFGGLDARGVGVFVNAPLAELLDACRVAKLEVLQLHGEEDAAYVDRLRAAGGWAIWKAVRVRNLDDVSRALECYGERVDGLLLDGWSPAARGGTGQAFSWEAVAGIRAQAFSSLKLIAAGGLNIANVQHAIALLRPDAIDISSGLEVSPGIKDPAAIAALMRTLRGQSS